MVRMAEQAVSANRATCSCRSASGSCIGLALVDQSAGVAGLVAHRAAGRRPRRPARGAREVRRHRRAGADRRRRQAGADGRGSRPCCAAARTCSGDTAREPAAADRRPQRRGHARGARSGPDPGARQGHGRLRRPLDRGARRERRRCSCAASASSRGSSRRRSDDERQRHPLPGGDRRPARRGRAASRPPAATSAPAGVADPEHGLPPAVEVQQGPAADARDAARHVLAARRHVPVRRAALRSPTSPCSAPSRSPTASSSRRCPCRR